MIKVSVTKTRNTPVGKLVAMGDQLKIDMTGPLFTDPQPMTPDALQTLITNFSSTQSTFKSVGKLAKPPYTAATLALRNGLVLYAPYIDKIAKGDITTVSYTHLTLPTIYSV